MGPAASFRFHKEPTPACARSDFRARLYPLAAVRRIVAAQLAGPAVVLFRKMVPAALAAQVRGRGAALGLASSRLGEHRVNPFAAFSRAREAQPSAARRILAARLERGAADFSFQLNSALATALSRSAGEAAERSELRGRLRRHPIATSRAWASEVHALQLFPGQAADSSATKSIEKKEPR